MNIYKYQKDKHKDPAAEFTVLRNMNEKEFRSLVLKEYDNLNPLAKELAERLFGFGRLN